MDPPDFLRHARLMMEKSKAALELKALRKAAGLTVKEVADALGMPVSTYASYEDKYKKPYLPLPFVQKLVVIFREYNIPESRLLSLAGLGAVSGLTGHNRKGQHHGPVGEGAATLEPVKLMELDVRAAAGTGQAVEDYGSVNEWRVPGELVKFATNSPADRIKIITVVGDSMPEHFRPFDKVMVDTQDTRPTPPGIFVVWDGLGLVVKRVHYLPHTDPPTVQIASDNPKYPPYERVLGEAFIQGRVIGKWLWI